MGRDTVQLETTVSTITDEYLLEFTSEYCISEDLYLELPDRGDRIVDFPKGKIGMYTKFFEFANFRIPISQFLFDILGHYQIHLVFPTTVAWRTSAPKDSMPLEGTYSVEDVAILNIRRAPIQKQPETLLCLVGLSRRYFLGDDVYPIFLHDDGRDGFVQPDQRSKSCHDQNRHPSSCCSRGATANDHRKLADRYGGADRDIRVFRGTLYPREFLLPGTTGAAPNIVEEEGTTFDVPLVSKRRLKRANEESNVNAPWKLLRKDFDVSHPTQSTVEGKSLASIRVGASSTDLHLPHRRLRPVQ
ncbi:hypothetical protein Tco_1464574 [Tanacetum coccineum]